MPITPSRPLYGMVGSANYAKLCDAQTIIRRTKEFWESVITPMEKLVRNRDSYPVAIQNVIDDFHVNVYPHYPVSALVQLRAMCISRDVPAALWPVVSKKGAKEHASAVSLSHSSSKAAGAIVVLTQNPNGHNYGINLPFLILPGSGQGLKAFWKNEGRSPLAINTEARPECPFEVGNNFPSFSNEYYRKPTMEEVEVLLSGIEAHRECIFGASQGG